MNQSERVLTAVFADAESARTAFRALEADGVHDRWLAVTSATSPVPEVAASSDGVLGAIGRFFSGEGNSLQRALEDRGVASEIAARVEGDVPPGGAVIVVRDDRDAASLLAEAGGTLAGDDAFRPARRADDEASLYDAPGDGADELGARSDDVRADEARRVELREERLSLDKRRVADGEATVGTHVETRRTTFDVPVSREELFIERRPVNDARPASGAVGDGETIHVPLMREEIVVDKIPVVREDVTVGQRRVDDVRHVDETLRRDVLDVNDGGASSRGVRPPDSETI